MFCLREKPYQNIVIQQNEKSTQGKLEVFHKYLKPTLKKLKLILFFIAPS